MILRDYINYFSGLVADYYIFSNQSGNAFRIASIEEAISDFIDEVNEHNFYFRLIMPSVDTTDNGDYTTAITQAGFEIGKLAGSFDFDQQQFVINDVENVVADFLTRMRFDSEDPSSWLYRQFNRYNVRFRYKLVAGDSAHAAVVVLFSLQPNYNICLRKFEWKSLS